MSAQQFPGPTPDEILIGGTRVSVSTRTGSVVECFVRMLPVSEYPDYVTMMEDEEKAVDLFTKTPGLAATLPPMAIGTIVEEGERVNAAFFPWCVRRVRRVQRVAPGALESNSRASINTSQASASAAV